MGSHNKQNVLGNDPVKDFEFHTPHTNDKFKKQGEEKEFPDGWEYTDKSQHASMNL